MENSKKQSSRKTAMDQMLVGITIPSSPSDRKAIKDAMQEISHSLTRIEAERDLIKETVKDVCKKYSLPNRAFRKLASTYHKQNFSEEAASFEEFETLYDAIVETK